MTTATRIQVPRGLNLPITGAPDTSEIHQARAVAQVALISDDYHGMKPTMFVSEGDRVLRGQLLFEDKKTPGVKFTAPATGTVSQINRGAKRKFESLVIETESTDEQTRFDTYEDHYLANMDRAALVASLVNSGMWTAFRTRPYDKVPAPESEPHSLFVTAMDTNPLAADPVQVLDQPEYERWFSQGLQAISALTSGKTYLCIAEGANVPGRELEQVEVAEFSGPHPAGLVGTHIHFLDPVCETKTVWHIGYQDVVAIGHLLLRGELLTQRTIALSGPAARSPRLLNTQLGASLKELCEGETNVDAVRTISGSVLAGRAAPPPLDFLGRYHQQISLLPEGYQRELLGWAMPGFSKFSITRTFASAWGGGDTKRSMNTSTQGSVRAIVPIGTYEKVMPLDIVATPLLKALMVNDSETAQALGCLELSEEDLSLCTFVCPGKNDYGTKLRQCLEHIEREG